VVSIEEKKIKKNKLRNVEVIAVLIVTFVVCIFILNSIGIQPPLILASDPQDALQEAITAAVPSGEATSSIFILTKSTILDMGQFNSETGLYSTSMFFLVMKRYEEDSNLVVTNYGKTLEYLGQSQGIMLNARVVCNQTKEGLKKVLDWNFNLSIPSDVCDNGMITSCCAIIMRNAGHRI